MKKPNLILLIFILTLSFIGCKEKKKEVETEKKVTADLTIETVDYEIIKIEDQSRKALGKKSLSQYQTSEIEKLPTNKKNLYKIVLSKDVKENQVKPTIEKIITKLTSDDSDIDEIILWLYTDKEVTNNPYDIGTAIWAPNGELGNIDANIAKTNNRKNYKIEYKITKNLNEYFTQKSKSEIKFGFTEDERKQIFKDIVRAEDKANEHERIEQDKVLDVILKRNEELDDKNREQLKSKYDKISENAKKIRIEQKSKILKKYKITEEQVKEISTEALTENWPFE